jgi:hypothetical protein
MDNIQFDKHGIEIISREEEVKRAFQYPITYLKFKGIGHLPEEEMFNNPSTIEEIKWILEKRKKALSKVNHKIKVSIDGLQTLESTDSNIVLQYFENNAKELTLSRVERVELRYERDDV